MGQYFDFFTEITYYFSLFYPILYLKGFKVNSKAFKIFAIYLVVIALVQLSLKVTKLVFVGTTNTLYLFHYYFIFQFILLSFFYKELLGFKWIYIVTVACLLFFGYQYIDDPSMYFRYNPLGAIISQMVIVLYSILYFYKRLSEKGEFLIVNIGVFFYMLSSVLIFASGNLVFDTNIPKSTVQLLGDINTVLYFIFQLLIVTEWWKNYSDGKNQIQ